MSMACQLFDLECRVFMVSASYHQKPYRRTLMEVWGAQLLASPSNLHGGRSVDPQFSPRVVRLAFGPRPAGRLAALKWL
jgi:predicted alternative tryptophan synthase beta-subunit